MFRYQGKFSTPERKDREPDLKEFDIILLNSSAGKDSQAMATYVCRLAEAQGVKNRVCMVHADLGEMEWPGTKDLAILQATVYFNIPIHIVTREENLLNQIERRGRWPDSRNRYCTSDHKRDRVAPLMTHLVDHWRKTHGNKRRCRVLNCMGLRAEESPARAVKKPFAQDSRLTNLSRRDVHIWFPIFRWTERDVWFLINQSGVPYHYAYDLGMPRLSCVFCVFASASALMLAGYHNPKLLDRYVEVERRINHRFQNRVAIETIKQRLESGERPASVANWRM